MEVNLLSVLLDIEFLLLLDLLCIFFRVILILIFLPACLFLD